MIRAAWRDTGLWPFNKSVLRANIAAHLGPDDSDAPATAEAQATEFARRQMNRLIAPITEQPQPVARVILTANQAHTCDELLELDDWKQQEAAAKVRDKEESRQTAVEKKIKRAEDHAVLVAAKLSKYNELALLRNGAGAAGEAAWRSSVRNVTAFGAVG